MNDIPRRLAAIIALCILCGFYALLADILMECTP